MRIRISSLDPRFPADLRYPRGPTHIEAIGAAAGGLMHLPARVAIVGTRRPPPHAWQYAHWLAATLARAGATIFSGGAYGIDSAAHEGALSVSGRTVAVLPTSVDKLSPAGNAALFRRITRDGALVGFLDAHEVPRFHERNAAIVALVEHVIVVAAPIKSGARNTAHETRRLNRRLWVVPGATGDPAFQGSLIELTLGGNVLISPLPILRALGLPTDGVGTDVDLLMKQPWLTSPVDPNPAPPPRIREPAPAVVTSAPAAASSFTPASTTQLSLPSPTERLLLETLRERPATIDELALRTSLAVASVRSLLLTWSVEGVVREGPSGLFRLVSS